MQQNIIGRGMVGGATSSKPQRLSGGATGASYATLPNIANTSSDTTICAPGDILAQTSSGVPVPPTSAFNKSMRERQDESRVAAIATLSLRMAPPGASMATALDAKRWHSVSRPSNSPRNIR